MDNRNYSTEAIILSRKNFGEADRIITVFSKHYGKIRLIAKGIRRPNSRKRGSLEIFNYVRLLIAGTKSIDIITDVEVKEDFKDWRTNLERIGIAYQLAETIERLTVDSQENGDIFSKLVKSFERLRTLEFWNSYYFVNKFKKEILEDLGFLEKDKNTPPNIDHFIEDLTRRKLYTKKIFAKISS